MRSAFRSVLALAAIGLSPAVLAAQKQLVTVPGMNVTATLSPAIRAGNLLFISGQLPNLRADADTSIQGQTKSAMEKIKTVVEAAGGTMADVVKCTVFLVDVKEFGGMNSVYSTFFAKEPPTRSTVVVAALVSAAAKLEVECVASLAK